MPDPELKPEEFHARTEEHVGGVQVVATGKLDPSTVHIFSGALSSAEPPDCSRLILDVREVTFADPDSLRVVVDAVARARRSGRPVVVKRGSGPVRRLLALVGAETLVTP